MSDSITDQHRTQVQSLIVNATKSSTLPMLIPPATSTMLFFTQVTQCPVFLHSPGLAVSTASHSSPSYTRIRRQGMQFTHVMSERAPPTVPAVPSQKPAAHHHGPEASPEARRQLVVIEEFIGYVAAVIHMLLLRQLKFRSDVDGQLGIGRHVKGLTWEHPPPVPPSHARRQLVHSVAALASCTPKDETCSTDPCSTRS